MSMAKAGKGTKGAKGEKAGAARAAPERVPPEDIHCVFCYWTWRPAGQAELEMRPWAAGRWELSESWPGDGDGYALRAASTGGGRQRQEWERWTKEGPGRAVTMWTIGGGVTLMAVRPEGPAGRYGMVAARAWERLAGLPDWHEYLEDGYRLVAGTVNAACREMGWPEHYTGG